MTLHCARQATMQNLIGALEELARTEHAITIEYSTGEGWSVSIAPIEFHPETEYPPMRWMATDEWCGSGETMEQAIARALTARQATEARV